MKILGILKIMKFSCGCFLEMRAADGKLVCKFHRPNNNWFGGQYGKILTATVVQTELARSVRRIRSIFYVLTEKTVILFCLLTGGHFCVFLCIYDSFSMIFSVLFQHFL